MNTTEGSNSITIITMTDATDTKGALPFGPQFKKQISVESEVLSDNLKTFLKAFNSILDEESNPDPRVCFKTIKVTKREYKQGK